MTRRVTASPARLAGIVGVLLLAAVLVAAVAMPTAAPDAAPADASELVTVVRIVDGDTVLVEIDGRVERVRYVGIDAPELESTDGGRAADCFGPEARHRHVELVAGRQLRMERDRSDRDRFDRLLRHARVEIDGEWRHVGELLVAEGAAHARSYPPDTSLDGRLADAERRARDADAGLWGACGPG
ncbi:MAG: thermonuclease family protein [Chloroflexi bacterium]|nr:thermonuclease family protein [Chloroflexota bacterium]